MKKATDYKAVLPLISGLETDKVYPLSITEGKQSGDIYVDDTVNPTVCLWWHRCGFGYLSGRYTEETVSFILGMMRCPTDGHSGRLALQTGNDMTIQQMLMQDEKVMLREHYLFAFAHEMHPVSLPDGYELKRIDETNYDLLTGHIIPSFSWESKESFLSRGFGYCVMNDGKVAACAFSAGVSDRYVDIGVETAEEYRGKGLGKAVAGAMVREILSLGKEPAWQCNASNEASYKLACSVGFEEALKHPLYVYKT